MPVREMLPLSDACSCSLTAAPLSAEDATRLARTLKALADPARLRIVSIVASQTDDTCACDFQGPLGLSQPTISHHCKVLVDAGILDCERRGTWAYYRVRPGALAAVAGALGMDQAIARV